MINKVGGPILLYSGKYINRTDRNRVEKLLSKIGNIYKVKESEIDAYTHLSSCSPAIVAEFLRLYVNVLMKEKKINRQKALKILIEMLEILALLLKTDGFKIIPQVCTKGGITEQGIRIMDNYQGTFFKDLTHSLLKRMEEVRKNMETKSNHLYIGKFDAVELAKKFGTPLYVYHGEKIEENFKKINLAIPYEPKQIHYAIMCNDRPPILKILLDCGAYIQANSLKEYKLARKVGFSNERISVTTTNMSTKDLKEFAKLGAMINFDSIEEIIRYGEIVSECKSKNRKIGIRVFVYQQAMEQHATNAPYLPKARVGIKQEKFSQLKEIAKKFDLKIVGVHGYLASNMLDLGPFLKLNRFLLDCAKQFPDIEYINFGAGFGIALKPDEEDFDWEAYGENILALMQEAEKFFGRKINFKIEPGRSLVGDAGILLTEVTNIKNMDFWKEVGVDCGFGVFARPYIYKWNEGGYHPIISANKFGQEANEIYTICGNSVLQSDYLAEDRKLPSLEVGDFLAILKTGAYGATMQSSFPGMRRAGEILVYRDKIKVIQKTEKI